MRARASSDDMGVVIVGVGYRGPWIETNHAQCYYASSLVLVPPFLNDAHDVYTCKSRSLAMLGSRALYRLYQAVRLWMRTSGRGSAAAAPVGHPTTTGGSDWRQWGGGAYGVCGVNLSEGLLSLSPWQRAPYHSLEM